LQISKPPINSFLQTEVKFPWKQSLCAGTNRTN